MNTGLIYELIGYAGSFFVALSLLMVSIVKLRLLNLAGCLFFVVYGVLISSVPIVLTNSLIALINIYHLVKTLLPGLEEFTYLSIGEARRYKLLDFLDVWESDLMRHFPLFNRRLLDEALARGTGVYLALKRVKVVGFALLIPPEEVRDELLSPTEQKILAHIRQNQIPEATLYLSADYVAPKYRDIGLASLFYRRLEQELPASLRFIATITPLEHSREKRYLRRHGYRSEGRFGEYDLYLKPVNSLPV